MWEITCTKKHYFQVGFIIVVQNANGNSIIECDVKQIVSDKIFCLKASEDAAEFQPDCDKTYVVKIARRDQSESNWAPIILLGYHPLLIGATLVYLQILVLLSSPIYYCKKQNQIKKLLSVAISSIMYIKGWTLCCAVVC